jgi:hypothetical protein
MEPTILFALAEHLRLTGSSLSVEQAVTEAIRDWQYRQETGAEMVSGRGYQWKSLFLPESTRLRMIHAGASHYALVIGDHIVYQGHKVSPREFTMCVSSSVRNAWREIWLRFPGCRDWRNAHTCRTEEAPKQAQATLTPVGCMSAATASMSDALRAMQALLERSAPQVVQQSERRCEPKRRGDDRMHDHCSFD